jgi:hypothetical protein
LGRRTLIASPGFPDARTADAWKQTSPEFDAYARWRWLPASCLPIAAQAQGDKAILGPSATDKAEPLPVLDLAGSMRAEQRPIAGKHRHPGRYFLITNAKEGRP